jgi:hypothetical protein
MTRQELINLISSELTVGCALPYNIPDAEYHRIIDTAMRWAYINYQYSVTVQYFVIPKTIFDSSWKKSRTIKLPDCVVSVFECKEIKNHSRLGGYFGADFSQEKIIAQEIYISPMNADDLLMRTAYESYWDLSKAFFLERISIDFNHNSKELTILGRDPKYDVWLHCYTKIQEDKLFEDWTFQRYCTAQAKISLGRILTTFTYNLPGGIQINGDGIKSEGQEELAQILETIKDENAPDFMFVFHSFIPPIIAVGTFLSSFFI